LDHSHLWHIVVVGCPFLEPRTNSAVFLEPADTLFHDGSATVGVSVEADAAVVSRQLLSLCGITGLIPR